MIVRASQPLMRGAQLTPVPRSYTGPRRGLHLVARRRGMGDTSGTIGGLVSSYANSFTYGLPSNVEHNMASAPDVVAQTLASAARNFCADQLSGTCDPNSVNTQIAQAVADYTAAYNAQVAKTAAQVSSGQIGVPMGYAYPAGYEPGGMSPTPVQPAPAPTSTAPVTTAPVQSNAPGSAVATVPTPASPTVVQSNSPAPAVVIPGVATATSFLTQSAFFGIPNWGLGLAVLGIGWFLFAGKGR